MKRSLILLGVLSFVVGTSAQAAKTNIRRGGYGFLFADHNSFINPGQFAIAYGAAIEGAYARAGGSDLESLTPSFVYGNGRLGFGMGMSRTGNNLKDGATAQDAAFAGLGFAMFKNRLTLGGSYARPFRTVAGYDGMVTGTLTFNAPKRRGPSVGIGYRTSLGTAPLQSGVAGLGYSFTTNSSMELNFEVNDLTDTSDWKGSFALNLGNDWLYWGGAIHHHALGSYQEAAARLGFVLGRYIDLSVAASQVLQTGGGATYGVTFRASF